MTLPMQPKSEALRRIYWRDEILQVMFWMEGEGLGSRIDPETLDRFLGGESEIALLHLDRLVRDGYVRREAEGFSLAERGRQEGGRLFADEFASLTRPTHGECGDECWCRQDPREADACFEQLAHR